MENKGTGTKITLAIVMISSFIVPFLCNAINLAIPTIGLEFNAAQNMLNWVVSTFLIATAVFLLPFGRLSDLFGRKKVFLIGMILLAVTSLACGLARSLVALIIFRVAQGIASSMCFGTSMAILTSVVPPEFRGRALGLNAAATYIGLSCGPILGGFLCDTIGWRGIFYFTVLLTLIIITLTVWKLKGEWKGEASTLDGGGVAFCILGQALLLIGLTDIATGLLYQISSALGVIFIAIFFLYERKHSSPILPVRSVAKNRTFIFSNFATLINYSATFAVTFMLSLYLQSVLHLAASASGLVLLIQPVLQAALSPVTGALSDKASPRILTSIGMGATTLGLIFLIFLSSDTPIVLIILNIALIGIGYALFSSPNVNSLMGSVDISLYGIATALMSNMLLIGQSISMAIISLITSVVIRDLPLESPAYAGKLMISLRTAFIIFAALGALGVWVSLLRNRGKANADA